MKIKKIWLNETANECISCGLCASIAPKVFEVPNKMIVLENVDFNEFENEINEAVESCPTEVITVEREN